MVVELAEALADVVPVDDPHFLFASDGASAVEQALKIAFQYWWNQGVEGRTRYLALGDAYHGDTVGSLSLGGGGFGTDLFDPLRFPVVRTPGYDDPGWADKAVAAVERHAGELAAVGDRASRPGGGRHARADPTRSAALGRACRRAGVLLIGDEVATGFGRTGRLFASEWSGLRPDLLCLGKGLTGGYLPMWATVASGAVYDAFLGEDLGPRTFYHGHSFGGNALAAAVALEHLRLIERAGRPGQRRRPRRPARDCSAGDVRPSRACGAGPPTGLMVGVELARRAGPAAGAGGCVPPRSAAGCCCAPSATSWSHAPPHRHGRRRSTASSRPWSTSLAEAAP